MKAIFEDRGNQYTASEGDVIAIDLMQDKKENDKLEFSNVLLLNDGNDVKIGTPYVEKAVVKAVVVENTRDKKVLVFKFKSKKNYSRTKGHKQPYTMIKIESISA
ncbi:MAG TPA: 50S ribosomal protein L21 [Spirochaetota bacterium]|jgi:large subunit ribosomal protein L21|nr:MAG: 50S ribosomal protein L21 [Spirochaetes bacterium ADurb.Bin133]HNZ27117.1 50S ribosomal protein L21 [Spirochaetota bacterium]HPY86484.1 50S ribosomal protein L21 [Spirochaetota bacterium]HQB60299.1 50S ribosomal protein L21 [Spirochaetota bacterium]